MTRDLHCHEHLGVHRERMRRNIFGRMYVCDMSGLAGWSGLRMILPLRASVFGCDNRCDPVGDGVCAGSTCKGEVQAAQPSSPVAARVFLGSQFLRDRLGKR